MTQKKATGANRKSSPGTSGSSAEAAGVTTASGVPSRLALVVLGMHRSGTSALTRVINMLGAQVPHTLMGGDQSNITGHWESTVVRALNDDVLASGGSDWQDWHVFQPRWYETVEPDAFRPRALQTLEDEFGDAPMIVFKDPRVCRIFPFWRPIFAEAGLEVKVILALRHPVEVAASLNNRNGLSDLHGLLLWLRHVLAAEHASRGMTRAVVSFEGFMTDPIGMATDLQDRLGILWPRLSENMSEQIVGLVKPELRHHRAQEQRQIGAAPALRTWLAEVYDIMLRWAESGEDPADHAALDRVRQSMDHFATPMREVIATLNEVNSEKQALRETIRKRDAERIELKACIESAVHEAADLKKQLESVAADRNTAEQAKKAAPTELARENEALQDGLKAGDAEWQTTEQSVKAELVLENKALKRALRQLELEGEATADSAEAARKRLLREIEALQADQARRDAYNETAAISAEATKSHILRERNMLQDDLRRREAELDTANKATDAARSELVEMRAALDRDQAGIQRADNDIRTLQEKLEHSQQELLLSASNVRRLEQNESQAQAREQELQTLLVRKEGEIETLQTVLQQTEDRLAQTESALRQRAHEAEQTAADLRTASAAYEHDQTKLRTELSEIHAQLLRDQTNLDKAQKRLAQHEAELARVRADSERDLNQRFEEIGALTRQLMEREDALNQLMAENTLLIAQSEQGHGLAGRVSGAVRVIIEGGVLGRNPLRRFADRHKARLLQVLGLFDASWYAGYYTDVREADADPAMHFVRHGFAEGRAASQEMLDLQNGRAVNEPVQQ